MGDIPGEGEGSTNCTPGSHSLETLDGPMHAIFASLDEDKDGKISSIDLIEKLENCGLFLESDMRLSPLHQYLKSHNGLRREVLLKYDEFVCAVKHCNLLIQSAISGELVIPNFQDFCAGIKEVCEEVQSNDGGEKASYIQELAHADSSLFGVSICTVDGQRYSWGACDDSFCVQSCAKPISYMAACAALGIDTVHEYVGREPSGVTFNSLLLKELDSSKNDRGAIAIPHNPLVNSGAIMTSGLLLHNNRGMATQFKDTMAIWKKLFGGSDPGFCNATYLSEKETAHRNWCLAHMMKEQNSFPQGFNIPLAQVLEYYFQTCSIKASCVQMSIMSATLANGGANPLTSERIFPPDIVRNCLTLMLSCGMYDYSGEWAFTVGLPAKSGVSGCVFIVVPNLMGIAIFSPNLDRNGNSVRGIDFAEKLLKKYALHMNDNLSGLPELLKKIDLRKERDDLEHNNIIKLLFAAAGGDLLGLQRMKARGAIFTTADYDQRTALHIAASEGHLDCVKYLCSTILSEETVPGSAKKVSSASLSPIDRWGRTPLDDAIEYDHPDVIEFLKSQGATAAIHVEVDKKN